MMLLVLAGALVTAEDVASDIPDSTLISTLLHERDLTLYHFRYMDCDTPRCGTPQPAPTAPPVNAVSCGEVHGNQVSCTYRTQADVCEGIFVYDMPTVFSSLTGVHSRKGWTFAEIEPDGSGMYPTDLRETCKPINQGKN